MIEGLIATWKMLRLHQCFPYSPLSNYTIRLGMWYHWFDHSKAREELQFSPQPCETAITNSLTWWKENQNKV